MTGRSQTVAAGKLSRPGRFGSRLRDARIRSKLGLILIVPLIAVVALAGVRLADGVGRALAADQVQSLTAVSVTASKVSNSVHLERTQAALLLAGLADDPGAFNSRSVETDDAIAAYQAARAELGDPPAVVTERLSQVDRDLEAIGTIRQQVLSAEPTTVSAAVVRYGVLLSDLLSYQETVGEAADDPELAEQIRAVAAMSKAKTLAADAEAIAFASLVDGELTTEELTAFLATQTGQQEAFLAFDQAAGLAQRSVAERSITGGNVVFADRAVAAMLRSAGSDLEITAETAMASFRGIATATQWAEEQLLTDLLQSATEQRDAVFQQVLIESIAVLLALIIAVAVAVLLARMLARSLGQLRQNALAVAERELPETVERLSDPRTLGENTPAQLAAQIREPIQLRSRDEVGEVAQAFNLVHREAVRVAAEQAALRTSVSAMFLSLARRSQSLVDRMISQLDEIERHEEDPKRLARMFTLDHLATRMRRNDENLLVLAGADSSPPRSDDALVADVLRAAQSEVEHYDRIEFGTVDSDVSVVANAVNDTVRLVAELFDNATRFSAPDSAVVCEARRLGDHVIIQIEDRGVGMSQDQVNRLNAWLATPPTLEVTTFRKMGLAVVARLASRHQIRVELRCDPNYGTIAYVALPRPILVLPRSRTRSLEMPAPRSPLPVEQAPAAVPPVPARHLGQLSRRSPEVAHHAASWRTARTDRVDAAGPGENGHAIRSAPVPQSNEPNQFDLPVAGRPLYDLTTPQYPASASASDQPPPPEATMELPIFKEMEQVWFRSQADDAPSSTGWEASRRTGAPSAGGYSPSAAAGPGAAPSARAMSSPPAAHEPMATPAASPPPPSGPPAGGGEPGNWRTAADFGWRAAAAAASPTSGGATASGLPKRVPQAQLVPGSVDSLAAASAAKPQASAAGRRSPEEIRGLLSAYHRGVQRGRESGAR